MKQHSESSNSDGLSALYNLKSGFVKHKTVFSEVVLVPP